mmetsp:Transcript_26170/g.69873  ORF Transcript_26170/g.69873 Transcript_26170/m.69873 type:complete len:230 (+) Transcript_26170:41-730(+)
MTSPACVLDAWYKAPTCEEMSRSTHDVAHCVPASSNNRDSSSDLPHPPHSQADHHSDCLYTSPAFVRSTHHQMLTLGGGKAHFSNADRSSALLLILPVSGSTGMLDMSPTRNSPTDCFFPSATRLSVPGSSSPSFKRTAIDTIDQIMSGSSKQIMPVEMTEMWPSALTQIAQMVAPTTPAKLISIATSVPTNFVASSRTLASCFAVRLAVACTASRWPSMIAMEDTAIA